MSLVSWFRREPPSATVAPLRSEHAPRLADLHAAAFARPWDALDFERLLADRGVTGDGLFLGRHGALVGFALSRRAADEAEILSITVEAEARGRGHGRVLLAGHLDALARQGVRVVHLEVEEGNAPALVLYRGIGFEEVGRRPGYYVRPDGSRACALTMSARL